MLKTKIKKIKSVYIQEVFWLFFVVVLSWVLIAARSDNTQVDTGLAQAESRKAASPSIHR